RYNLAQGLPIRFGLSGANPLRPTQYKRSYDHPHTHHSPLELIESSFASRLAFSNRKVSALWHRNIGSAKG
ncbi:MAG TPA: hypothetical protein VFI48_12465, partial [Hyphomicrobiaceae bacterium]|nr:hypothetical protein [Hyphomicrobiaceae bacterium]